MNKSGSPSVTIEDTIATILKLAEIPKGLTLEDVTEFYMDEAEDKYEEAKDDGCSDDELAPLKHLMESCKSRHFLAQSLSKNLYYDAINSENTPLVVTDNSPGLIRLTRESVAHWALDNFGINIPEYTLGGSVTAIDMRGVAWEDITIKIYKDFKLSYSIRNKYCRLESFRNIGLMGANKVKPNQIGLILIGLSKKKKYSLSKKSSGSERKNMTLLKKSLRSLTGLQGNPFAERNEYDGYKPLFKLIDDRRNADKRAKEKAIHSSYRDDLFDQKDREDDDAMAEADDFRRVDDAAQRFLDENG